MKLLNLCNTQPKEIESCMSYARSENCEIIKWQEEISRTHWNSTLSTVRILRLNNNAARQLTHIMLKLSDLTLHG